MSIIKKVIGIALVFSLVFGASSPTLASEVITNQNQEVIVFYKNDTGKKEVLKNSVKVEADFEHVSALTVVVNDKGFKRLEANPNISYIEENIEYSISGGFNIASVPQEESQWNLQATKASKAWEDGYTGKNVKVAIIDTGIAPHPELNIAGGISTVDYTNSWFDDNGHGTHVAGIVGAKRDNRGMVGVAPDVSLYSVKALEKDGKGTLNSILEGIEWSISNGMDIINLSLTSPIYSQALEEAVNQAYANDILIVAGSGNIGDLNGTGNTVGYPAKYDSAIAVSAVNSNLVRWEYSSTGQEVEFSAPGVQVVSTYLDGAYARMDGTSQATPHVTGFLALLKEKNPSMNNQELRYELKKYVTDLGVEGKDPWYGYGFINYFQQQLDSPDNPEEKEGSIPDLKDEKLEQAKQAVEFAEKSKKLSDIEESIRLIQLLEDSQEKDNLYNQINQLIQENISFAELQVLKAEKEKNRENVRSSKVALNEIPDGSIKNALQNRIQKVENWLINSANQRVTIMERSKTYRNVITAQNAVNELEDGIFKTNFQSRIETVKKWIVADANNKVTNAERLRTQASIFSAQYAIDQIIDSEDKVPLQKRLDAVKNK